MSSVEDQIRAKKLEIDNFIQQNNSIVPEPNYLDFANRQNNFNINLARLRSELKTIMMQDPIYKKFFEMQEYGVL